MNDRKLDELLGISAAQLRKKVKESQEKDIKEKFKFNLTPNELYDKVSEFVIGQEEALQKISNAICYHYKGLSKHGKNSKNNLLLIGPTGCGKSYVIQKIVDILKVPLISADATKYSGTGYVGDKIENLIQDLVIKSDYDINAASRGVIYLDEIDKIAVKEGSGRDVSGRDVQNGLLKIIEGGDVRVVCDGTERVVNTKDILFIGGGAFSDLYKILRATSSSAPDKQKEVDDGEILYRSKSHDLLKSLQRYGMIPELLGRIPVIAKFKQLTKDDLVKILKTSKESPIKLYQEDFTSYGINIKFAEDSYDAIATLAFEKGMGARGLKSVIEENLSPYKFYLPGSGLTDMTISGESIRKPEETLLSLIEAQQNKQAGGKNGKNKS